MEIYRCDLILHDYLFFATTERGKVAETGPFIHNYALTYALGWATSPWHNAQQKPHYREELAHVEKKYVTPARLIHGSSVVNQYNTMSENYTISKAQSIGYPDWGFVKCFRPGSLFRFYVMSAEVVHFPHYLRLGKFMAKAALTIQQATAIKQVQSLSTAQKHTPSADTLLLNWEDLVPTARPVAFDIIASSLPTRLIDHAVFDSVEAPCVAAQFPDTDAMIHIPLEMGYFGGNTCASW